MLQLLDDFVLRPLLCPWISLRYFRLPDPSLPPRVSRFGSVTARHSSSGRQPNFAALNRGRHLYSAERSSRWALAHILVYIGGVALKNENAFPTPEYFTFEADN